MRFLHSEFPEENFNSFITDDLGEAYTPPSATAPFVDSDVGKFIEKKVAAEAKPEVNPVVNTLPNNKGSQGSFGF